MSRTANAIKMLEILQACGRMSKRELASRLNTNERNIYELKKELMEAGFIFKELKGRSSGYELDKQYLFKMPQLSDDQKEALESLTEYVISDEYFIGHQETQEAMMRVCSHFETNQSESKMLFASTVHKPVSRNDLQELYTKINYAIKSGYKVEVYYESYYSERLRIVSPYDLFKVDHEWYWIGCEESSIFKLYRLDRIKTALVSDEKFWMDPKYKRQDFVDNYGLKNIGEKIRVELLIGGAYKKSMMENPVGKNVSITELQNGTILYESTIRGDYKALELVLRMGADCIVKKPDDLRLIVVNSMKKMATHYEVDII